MNIPPVVRSEASGSDEDVLAAIRQRAQERREQERMRQEELERFRSARAKRDESQPLSFVNKGIAQFVGGPVDLINTGMGLVGIPVHDTPFMGSQFIRQGMASAGIPTLDRDPQTVGESIGQVFGEASAALTPMGLGARALSLTKQAPGVIARTPTTTGRIAEAIDMAQTQTPRAALMAEGLAATGAGMGRHLGEQQFEGNVGMQALSEVGGAVGTALAPTAISQATRKVYQAMRKVPYLGVTSEAIDAMKRVVYPYTKEGGETMVSQRLRGLSSDPEEAVARINEQVIALSETGQPLLSPATRTGDKRLMALEEALLRDNPKLEDRFAMDLAVASARLRNAMDSDIGDISNFRRFLETRIERITAGLEARVQKAAAKAAQELSQLGPTMTREDAAITVRNALESAYNDARVQERQLWSQIPTDEVRSSANSQRALRSILSDITPAQRNHIPDEAFRFLDPDSADFIGDSVTIKDLHGLYSELGFVAQNARAGSSIGMADRQKARIAEQLREAIMKDIGRGDDTEAGQMLEAAMSFSRQLNEKFRKGTVGRLLGEASEGGARVADELTLTSAVGVGGQRGIVGTRDIAKAVGDGDESLGAISEYLKDRFMQSAVDRATGRVKPEAAQKFLADNRELMDMFPALRDQIRAAETAEDMARTVRDSSDAMRKKLQNPTVSYAARVLGSPVNKEISTILNSANPRKMARELTKKLKTGVDVQARLGLRDATIEEFFKRAAKSGRFDEQGNQVYSGRAMLNMIEDARVGGALSEILTDAELSRLRQVAKEFSLIETRTGALPNVGDPMEGLRSRLAERLAQVFAVRQGTAIRKGSGAGALQIAKIQSDMARKIAQRLNNARAEKMLIDAIGDPGLYEALLRGISPSSAAKARAVLKINAWVGGTGREMLEDMGLIEPWDESGFRSEAEERTFTQEAEDYFRQTRIPTRAPEPSGRLGSDLPSRIPLVQPEEPRLPEF